MSLTSQTERTGTEPDEPYDQGSWTPRFSAKARIVTAVAMFTAVAAGGWYFSIRPEGTSLDGLAYRIIPNEWSLHPLLFIADFGRPRVVVPAVVFCFFIALIWDRRRAVTCAIAPGLAVAITEYLAKPAVGRMYGGTLCYPSGHMTAVAAVTSVFVLSMPPRLRVPALVLGVIVDLVVGVTLLLLRWHYLTDVIAGTFVSVGTTLLVDSVVHMLPVPWLRNRRTAATVAS
jgi:membrane-associated phospholipid phosphatase